MGAMRLMSLLLLHLTLCAAQNEFYSSTDHMTELVVMERKLLQSFRRYVKAEEAHLDSLKSALQALEKVCENVPEDLEKYISNPLTAYKLISRLRSEWTTVDQVTRMSPSQDFLDELKLKSQELPSDSDVDGVALGLIRLQETYGLQPSGIMASGLRGLENTTTLDADESYHVATVAFQKQKFQYSFLWMQETLRQINEGVVTTVTKREALHFLAPLSFQMGNLPMALDLVQQLLDQDPSDMETLVQLAFYRTLLESSQRLNETQTSVSDFDSRLFALSPPVNNPYEALCRGESIKMTSRRQKALLCRYGTGGGNPRLIYAPVKEEAEWDHPPIIRYHDLISQNEVDAIKRLSRPKLERAKVKDYETGETYATEDRVSKSAWLSEEEGPVVARVNQRIADVTGLDMNTAELLQVANYGIGGQYEPHFDSKLNHDSDYMLRGGRIATVLIYMSDVEVGGATVFPTIGAALQPQKGSAVFWYNLLRSGEKDDDTLHAACPVFVGNKWVANKWIRARGQEFKRRCSLSKSD